MVRHASRRQWLKSTAIASVAGLAGCSGGDDSGGGSGDGSDDDVGSGTTEPGDDEPSPPWTTETLAKMAEEEGGTLNIYNTSAGQEGWDIVADLVREEYPFFEVEVQRGSRNDISQRFLQEKQAGNIRADIIMNLPPLTRDEDPADHFVANMDKFAKAKEIKDKRVTPYNIAATFNYAPIGNLIYNTDVVEEQGIPLNLLKNDKYNAFLDDQFSGTRAVIDRSPNWVQLAGILREFSNRHSEDLSEKEWFSRQVDQLEISLAKSATPGTRLVGQGQAPIMYLSYTVVYRRVAEGGLPIKDIVYDGSPVPGDTFAPIEVDGAPNPWTARFAKSVFLEPFVQKGISEAGDKTPLTPGRPNLDYPELDDYSKKLLNTELKFISAEQIKEFRSLAQDVFKSVVDR